MTSTIPRCPTENILRVDYAFQPNLFNQVGPWECNRADGRDLIREWKSAQEGLGRKEAKYVTTKEELAAVDVEKSDSLLGKYLEVHKVVCTAGCPQMGCTWLRAGKMRQLHLLGRVRAKR